MNKYQLTGDMTRDRKYWMTKIKPIGQFYPDAKKDERE